MKISFNLFCIIILLQSGVLFSKNTKPVNQTRLVKESDINSMMMCPNDTVYVNHAATGVNSGNSWADAYTSLSNALVMAHTCSNVKVVRVAGGTYLPQNKPFSAGVEIITSDIRDRTFHLKDGLKIYGGYNASTGIRNINANPTILSGDYNGNDVVAGSGSTLIITNLAENAYHVVLSISPVSGAIGVTIDGFTIKGGCANGTGSHSINGSVIIRNGGGGIALYKGNNICNANIIINNTALAGGSAYASLATVNNTNSVFLLNVATNSGAGIHSELSTVNLTNTTILNNRAVNGGATFLNGGTANFINSTFGGNYAASHGGAIYLNAGTNHNLKNSIIYNNSAVAFTINLGVFTTSNNNIVQGGISSCTSCPNSNGNINPLFANIADVDGTDNIHRTVDDGYNVLSTSPAIDAGTLTGAPTIDITGFTRTGNPDIGAYEYHIAAPPCSLTASFTNNTSVSCNGDSNGTLTVTASSGTANYSYAWSHGASTLNSPDNTNTVSGLSAGSYTVTVTDGNACTASTNAVVTQPSVITPSVSVTSNYNGAEISCFEGNNGVLTASPSGGTGAYTYLWSNGANVANNANLIAGTYVVTVTDVNNCTASESAMISQPSAIIPTTTITNVDCNGGSNGSIDLSVSGGIEPYTYDWSNDGPELPDDDPQDLTGLAAGSYTVSVTDVNGCTGSTSATITQPLMTAYTFIGPGSDFNDSANWQGGCIPPLNDPNTVITVNSGQILNLNGNLTAMIINNGTVTGNVILNGDIINNGTVSPGN